MTAQTRLNLERMKKRQEEFRKSKGNIYNKNLRNLLGKVVDASCACDSIKENVEE